MGNPYVHPSNDGLTIYPRRRERRFPPFLLPHAPQHCRRRRQPAAMGQPNRDRPCLPHQRRISSRHRYLTHPVGLGDSPKTFHHSRRDRCALRRHSGPHILHEPRHDPACQARDFHGRHDLGVSVHCHSDARDHLRPYRPADHSGPVLCTNSRIRVRHGLNSAETMLPGHHPHERQRRKIRWSGSWNPAAH